jgi:hypothetical protein
MKLHLEMKWHLQLTVICSILCLFGCHNEECGDDTPKVDVFFENHTWGTVKSYGTGGSCTFDYPIPPASQMASGSASFYNGDKDFIEYNVGTACKCGALVSRTFHANGLEGGGEIFSARMKVDVFGSINTVFDGHFASKCLSFGYITSINPTCVGSLASCSDGLPAYSTYQLYRKVDPATSYYSAGITTGTFYIQWEDLTNIWCCKVA